MEHGSTKKSFVLAAGLLLAGALVLCFMLLFEPSLDDDAGELSAFLFVLMIILKGWRGWVVTAVFLGAGTLWLVDGIRRIRVA